MNKKERLAGLELVTPVLSIVLQKGLHFVVSLELLFKPQIHYKG